MSGMGRERRERLAIASTRVGLMEHASIVAFARFPLQLLLLAAPVDLLRAAQRAMTDEMRHTQTVFAFASALE